MQDTTFTADLKRKAITYGVVLGIISIVLGLASLVITKNGTSLYTTVFIAFALNFVVYIAFACYFILQLRKGIGGYWDFRTALRNTFIMLATSAVLATVGTMVFNVLYPAMQEESIRNMMNMSIEVMESAGLPDDQIDASIQQFEEELAAVGNLSIGQTIKGLAISLILYFVLALILAAIFKKERPVFIRPTEESAHPWQDNNNPPPSV